MSWRPSGAPGNAPGNARWAPDSRVVALRGSAAGTGALWVSLQKQGTPQARLSFSAPSSVSPMGVLFKQVLYASSRLCSGGSETLSWPKAAPRCPF